MKRDNNDKKLLKSVSRAVIGAVASAVLTPPVATYIGCWTLFTSKCVEQMVETEEDKETFRFIGECGKDIIFGGLVDCAIGNKAVSLVSHKTNSIGKEVSKEIAQNGMSNFAKELITTGKEISKRQKDYEFINNIKDGGSNLIDLFWHIDHKIHLDKGINYLENCEVCNE